MEETLAPPYLFAVFGIFDPSPSSENYIRLFIFGKRGKDDRTNFHNKKFYSIVSIDLWG